MMNIIRKLFTGVEPQYLVRSYLFSIVLTLLFFNSSESALMSIYVVISGLLFPFATVVWDDLMGMMMGNNIIILALPILFLWKFFKLVILFMFTPIIAPIGFIYIYISNGHHRKQSN